MACGFAQAATVTFETAGTGLTTYTDQGVTFTAGGAIFDATGTPNSTLGLLAQNSPRSSFRADIAGGAGFVSVDLGDFGVDPDMIFLEIYDAANTLLGSVSQVLDASFNGMVTLSLSASDISYALFGSRAPSFNGSSVYADNFSFQNDNTVPVASTLPLAALGLGLLAAGRRRKVG